MEKFIDNKLLEDDKNVLLEKGYIKIIEILSPEDMNDFRNEVKDGNRLNLEDKIEKKYLVEVSGYKEYELMKAESGAYQVEYDLVLLNE